MNNDYNLHVKDGVCTVNSRPLAELGCFHGFTTRIGGVSKAPFESMNLGWNRNEPRENVELNYKKLCAAYGMDYANMILVNYQHGANVLEVTRADRGRGMSKEPLPPCDGIVTRDTNVTLVTLHADCAAYFVFDKTTGAVGLAHAGWRGTYSRIGQNVINVMRTQFGSKSCDLYAAIAPCICENCFEVSASLAHDFANEFDDSQLILPHADKDHAYLDLRRASIIQFKEAGIDETHIFSIPCCTYERPDLFYSYRRDNTNVGAMAGFIQMT